MFSIMINGSLERYFPGRKGLRQGDPSSLFFFITEMDVLSPMLNRTPRVSSSIINVKRFI